MLWVPPTPGSDLPKSQQRCPVRAFRERLGSLRYLLLADADLEVLWPPSSHSDDLKLVQYRAPSSGSEVRHGLHAESPSHPSLGRLDGPVSSHLATYHRP